MRPKGEMGFLIILRPPRSALSPYTTLFRTAIPNLLNALQRGKQKRTMADMRDLAIAMETYNTDNNVYPPATTCATPAEGTPAAVGSGSFTLLKPTYIAVPPVQDGWKNFLKY